MRQLLTLMSCAILTLPVFSGTEYRVTATDSKGKVVTYEVTFGGGSWVDLFTAYDPVSDQFVYITTPRGQDAPTPEPAATIWDHVTGREIKLYKFPDVEQPLPLIPSMKEMKICPKTGDKEFKSEVIDILD